MDGQGVFQFIVIFSSLFIAPTVWEAIILSEFNNLDMSNLRTCSVKHFSFDRLQTYGASWKLSINSCVLKKNNTCDYSVKLIDPPIKSWWIYLRGIAQMETLIDFLNPRTSIRCYVDKNRKTAFFYKSIFEKEDAILDHNIILGLSSFISTPSILVGLYFILKAIITGIVLFPTFIITNCTPYKLVREDNSICETEK
jgi:hypothetical protein